MLHYIFKIPFLITALQAAIVNITVGENNLPEFHPPKVNATVGDVINFIWYNGTHNVVQASNILYCDSAIPLGITSGAPVNEPGKQWNFTITDPGYFFYFCQIDCANGMRGQIFANEATATTTTSMAAHRTNDPYSILRYPAEGAYQAKQPRDQGIIHNFLNGLQFIQV